MERMEVKENRSWAGAPLRTRWLLLGLAGTAGVLLLAGGVDRALPDARPPPPSTPAHLFSGELAHAFLVNLTAIGPRVAGSYENEVLAVRAVLAAARAAAAGASRHNQVEIDVHRASGAFSLNFFDGLNNMYRDVQSVVVRVRGLGAPPRPPRPHRSALLLNCHFDTVPDSPGASDDGAGCAVVLETMRALAATPRPLRHDVIFLLNGAEENIMQASHAFVTTHKWADSVRAFINVEACGAGGRAVLFQAGPLDPWLVELYANVPRPFGSSLAQELFESGLVPADTDFRIFRDFGGASGVDLAWAARGYVYHTRLDTAHQAPPAALQHAGDNVLAFAHALLSLDALDSPPEGTRLPVYFDVLGLWLVTARAPAALAVAFAALAVHAFAASADVAAARQGLYVGAGAWYLAVARALALLALAAGAGLVTSAGVGALQHALGARMLYYSRPWLLAFTHALPALSAASGVVAWRLRALRVGGVRVVAAGAGAGGGWWAARLVAAAVAAGWALVLLACVLRRLRSGFVPLLWVLSLGLAQRLAHLTRAQGGRWVAWWCLGSALPVMQTLYLAHCSIEVFVPITGRAGTSPLPPDVLMGLLTSGLTLAACSWLAPLAAGAGGRRLRTLALGGAALAALTHLSLLPASPLAGLAPAYTAARPQRYMVFHTRTTTHGPGRADHVDSFWVPHLDANTPASLRHHVPELARAEAVCGAWPYCGAPYSLPVLGMIARGYWVPARAPPAFNVTVTAATQALNHTHQQLDINVTGPSHVVVVVSPAAGAEAAWCDELGAAPTAAASWGGRHTYFFTLHDAGVEGKGGRAMWRLSLTLRHGLRAPPAHWATLSAAGHAMARARTALHDQLLARLPPWVAATGWGVHLHLLHV